MQFNLSVRFSHLHHHHLSLMCATEEKSRKWISTTTGIKRTEKLSKQSTTAEIMLRFSPFLVDPVAKVFFFLSSVCFSFHSALYYIRLEILLLGIISFVCLLYVAVSTLIPCRFACFPFVHVCVRSCFFFFLVLFFFMDGHSTRDEKKFFLFKTEIKAKHTEPNMPNVKSDCVHCCCCCFNRCAQQ